MKVRDAKDPDEFLKKFGPDKFKLLLEESANRVEYQLNAIRSKYDIREDDQKIRYVHEAAELISTLGSSVQREVYGGRVAESAGISMEAMKLEVNKDFKGCIKAFSYAENWIRTLNNQGIHTYYLSNYGEKMRKDTEEELKVELMRKEINAQILSH